MNGGVGKVRASCHGEKTNVGANVGDSFYRPLGLTKPIIVIDETGDEVTLGAMFWRQSQWHELST
jgi:hypothetical protein